MGHGWDASGSGRPAHSTATVSAVGYATQSSGVCHIELRIMDTSLVVKTAAKY